MLKTQAKYHLGQVLRHRKHPFRGVVFDVDAMFSNTEEWYDAIPEDSRPRRDQPFYHLLAENDQSYYVAYVSEQNLVPDETGAFTSDHGWDLPRHGERLRPIIAGLHAQGIRVSLFMDPLPEAMATA